MDRIYEAYYGDMGEIMEKKAKIRIHWIKDRVRGKNVLDVGCSQGILPILLGREGHKITAIDINAEAIAFAENAIAEESVARENVEFVVADFIAWDAAGKNFDTVIFGEILEHLFHPEVFLKKAYELLEENGTAVITVPFGIMDDPDHRQTFFYCSIFDIVNPYFEIQETIILGPWLGLSCRKRAEQFWGDQKIEKIEFQKAENAFWTIQRELLNRIKLYSVSKSIPNLDSELEKRFNDIVDLYQIQIDSLNGRITGEKEKNLHYLEQIEILNNTHQCEIEKLNETISSLMYMHEQEKLDLAGKYAQERICLIQQCECEKQELIKTVASKDKEIKSNKDRIMVLNRNAKQWEYQYYQLANSKLGRLTLKYWKIKDWFIFHFKKRETDEKTFRNFLKKIPGLRPLVLFVRSIFQNKTDEAVLAVTEEKISKSAYSPINNPQNLPTIAVIIPTYKKNDYFEPCLNSVLNQNYPADKLVVRVVANGDDVEYYKYLCEHYGNNKNIEVIYTEQKGAAAARIVGIERAKEDCIAFIDDDDLFAADHLISMAKHFVADISIICSGLADYYQDEGTYNYSNYMNKTIGAVGEGVYDNFLNISSLFSTMCVKLYKTEFLKNNINKNDSTLKHTEDVVFWCRAFDKILGKVYVISPTPANCYIRRITENSLSRPNADRQMMFFGLERLEIIDILTEIIFSGKDLITRKFIVGKIDSQVAQMKNYFESLSEDEKRWYIDNVVKQAKSPFFNKSLFATKKGFAFCHNFSPFVDASAFVASRRLSEISDLENELIGWKVLCANMENCRSKDVQFDAFFGKYQYVNREIIGNAAYFNEEAQYAWGEKAFNAIKDEYCEYIYSRSMWAGSHIAAYQYKKKNPDVIWYAEFSDPLYMGTDGELRKISRIYEGEKAFLNEFWKNVENMVYELADHIIYTNDNQREYMLTKNPDVDKYGDVRERSIVSTQPQTDSRYCNLVKSPLDLEPDNINIAYFGTFYAERKENDLFRILLNEKVCLHIFSNKTRIDLAPEFSHYSNRIKLHPLVPFFEMLNICTKMDYLLLNDLVFKENEINPYLPSKLADYLSTGTDILAIVHGDSILSKMHHERIIKIIDGNNEAIFNLRNAKNKNITAN